MEAQVIAAKRTPTELMKLIDKIEGVVRGNLRALRASLAEHTDRREVFGAMFGDWSQLRVVAHAG